MKPAAIQVTSSPGVGPEPDTDQDMADALSCLRMPETTMPLEVRAAFCRCTDAPMHQVHHTWPYQATRLLWPAVSKNSTTYSLQIMRET